MTKLPKSHPFAQAMLKAEKLERDFGKVTDDVMKIRKWAFKNYPLLFKAYMNAKNNMQEKRAAKEASKKDEAKRNRKIRHYSILKSAFTKPGFGRGPGDY